MRKLFKLLGVFLLFITLTGCPLNIADPIDPPNVKVNPSWFGTYECDKYFDYFGLVKQIVLGQHSGFEYRVIIVKDKTLDENMKKEGMKEPVDDTLTAHISILGGQEFLNVNMGGAGYYFYKISKTNDGFLMSEISDRISSIVYTTDDLKRVIVRNIGCELLYGDSFPLKKE
jgi:hypothetical protein